jgi:type I restriction enzyme M protein
MAKIYNYDVMFDDTSIDVSKEVALVWSIANSLRGAYTSDKYKDVIIPMVILRRLQCCSLWLRSWEGFRSSPRRTLWH